MMLDLLWSDIELFNCTYYDLTDPTAKWRLIYRNIMSINGVAITQHPVFRGMVIPFPLLHIECNNVEI